MDNSEYAEQFRRNFEAKFDTPEGQCWLWQGAKDRNGYGRMRRRRNADPARNYYLPFAHRLSYELHSGGPIPEGLHVLHKCDTPACVNPAHLFLGTHAENMADMDSKGRRITPNRKGERNGHSKLTVAQASEIRARYKAGESPTGIGLQFGIHRTHVWQIGTGREWKETE